MTSLTAFINRGFLVTPFTEFQFITHDSFLSV